MKLKTRLKLDCKKGQLKKKHDSLNSCTIVIPSSWYHIGVYFVYDELYVNKLQLTYKITCPVSM